MPIFLPSPANLHPPEEAALREALAKYPALDSSGTLHEAPQGLSPSKVWRLMSAEGDYAVKWRPDAKHPDDRHEWIADVLHTAKRSGATWLAMPLATHQKTHSAPLAQGTISVSPWLPGEPLCPQIGNDLQLLAINALAKFHSLVRSQSNRMISLREAPAVAQRVEMLADAAIPALTDKGGPIMERLRSGIESALPDARAATGTIPDIPTTIHPVQVDARPEHFLLHDGEVTGQIDFDAMRVDTPLIDLARLTGELAQGDAERRTRLVQAYGDASGEQVDPRLIHGLDHSGAVLAALNWARWLSAGARLTPAVQQRIEELLGRMGRLTTSL